MGTARQFVIPGPVNGNVHAKQKTAANAVAMNMPLIDI
jgi:hypothetical protein